MRKFALILTGFLVDLTGAEVAPGVWKAEAGKPEAYNRFYRSWDRVQVVSQISQAKFPFGHGSVALGLQDDKKLPGNLCLLNNVLTLLI